MGKLSRIVQKIFGGSASTAQFGQIGSLAAGAAVYTKDLETIQGLAQYLNGLFAITNNANQPPRIQDINSLYLLITSQIKYLFQSGIPEWDAGEDYYEDSICRIGSILYLSLTGTDGSPNTNHNPAVDAVNWLDLDAYYRNASNLNSGTVPLARIPSELTGKNAATATLAALASALAVARTISLSGDASGSTSFDGSGNVSIAATVAQATKLRTARSISLSGEAGGSANFDGSGNISITAAINSVNGISFASGAYVYAASTKSMIDTENWVPPAGLYLMTLISGDARLELASHSVVGVPVFPDTPGVGSPVGGLMLFNGSRQRIHSNSYSTIIRYAKIA